MWRANWGKGGVVAVVVAGGGEGGGMEAAARRCRPRASGQPGSDRRVALIGRRRSCAACRCKARNTPRVAQASIIARGWTLCFMMDPFAALFPSRRVRGVREGRAASMPDIVNMSGVAEYQIGPAHQTRCAMRRAPPHSALSAWPPLPPPPSPPRPPTHARHPPSPRTPKRLPLPSPTSIQIPPIPPPLHLTIPPTRSRAVGQRSAQRRGDTRC